MKYTREDAEARADATPELDAHRQVILANWPEGEEHWEWVCTAPVHEIVNWAEAVECAYATDVYYCGGRHDERERMALLH